ncbi:MAG: hypothetical protein WCR72_18980 [Bacteroidota bacterium]
MNLVAFFVQLCVSPPDLQPLTLQLFELLNAEGIELFGLNLTLTSTLLLFPFTASLHLNITTKALRPLRSTKGR